MVNEKAVEGARVVVVPWEGVRGVVGGGNGTGRLGGSSLVV